MTVYDIVDVRKHIAQECLEHVRHGTGNLVFNTFTGSGKTTTVLKTLYESESGFNWMYFAPYHSIILENIELSSVIDFYDIKHLKGRDKLCLSREYKEYAERGINIQPFCEHYCPLRNNECPYYRNLRELLESPTCFAGVHAHIPTLLQQILYERIDRQMFYMFYDVIVLDEFPTNTIYKQVNLTRRDVNYARDVLDMTGLSGRAYEIIMGILNELSLSTRSIGINYDRIEEVLLNFRGADFENFKEQYDNSVLNLVNERLIQYPPKEVVYMLMEIYDVNPDRSLLESIIYKSPTTQWMKGGIHLTLSTLNAFRNLPIKVIALDGTADLETWHTVLGRNTQIIQYDIEYKNTYQLVGARNPVSSLIRNNKISSTGEKILDIIETICRYRDNKVLLCGTKRIQSHFGKELRKRGVQNFMFANYYNLRSRNSYYEECDTCVLIHEPNIPPFQTRIIEHVLGLDSGLVTKINREDEMKQSIGRLRQNIPVTPNGRVRAPREIFILSSTGYQRLVPEAEYFTREDLFSYVKTGKKRTFFDKIKRIIKGNSPTTKSFLKTELKMSRNKLDYVLSILESQGIVRISWGKIEWLRDPNIDEENTFFIRIGETMTW